MARKDVNFTSRGHTAKQLLMLDPDAVNRMSRRELSRVVSDLGDVANKRLARLQKAGIASPAAYRGEWINRFSVKGKSVGELKAEYVRVKTFLDAQTSTIGGAKTWQRNSIIGLQNYDINLTKDQFDEFWRSYSKLKQMDPRAGLDSLKYDILQSLQSELGSGLSEEEAVAKISRDINKIYEEHEEQLNGLSSTAKLFNQGYNTGRGFGGNH